MVGGAVCRLQPKQRGSAMDNLPGDKGIPQRTVDDAGTVFGEGGAS